MNQPVISTPPAIPTIITRKRIGDINRTRLLTQASEYYRLRLGEKTDPAKTQRAGHGKSKFPHKKRNMANPRAQNHTSNSNHPAGFTESWETSPRRRRFLLPSAFKLMVLRDKSSTLNLFDPAEEEVEINPTQRLLRESKHKKIHVDTQFKAKISISQTSVEIRTSKTILSSTHPTSILIRIIYLPFHFISHTCDPTHELILSFHPIPSFHPGLPSPMT
ncbi:uncharacterized protein LY89DRAFT_108560 [Mollisia scopiformis]|uniref:Uncharacterized protein n=1 Tax=Mollisia scopiformis TaxID=149040 RepID=A0A194X659_MOLSC|nr:uncharacterized protein LY89DRAFT_108560 [Mollisia scopiformis]KUJ15297.1 hypothetical protein LY89DRAFT_108560 [Mollisia scopiformis]